MNGYDVLKLELVNNPKSSKSYFISKADTLLKFVKDSALREKFHQRLNYRRTHGAIIVCK